MIYSLGIDISKDDFAGCLQRYNLREQTYQVIARKTFKNKLSGFKACMRWLARHTKKQSAPSRVTMEATGVYYESLALYIQEHHHQVHLAVVLPSQSNKFIESQGHRSKTDKIDAYGLSQMGAERKMAPWKGDRSVLARITVDDTHALRTAGTAHATAQPAARPVS